MRIAVFFRQHLETSVCRLRGTNFGSTPNSGESGTETPVGFNSDPSCEKKFVENLNSIDASSTSCIGTELQSRK